MRLFTDHRPRPVAPVRQISALDERSFPLGEPAGELPDPATITSLFMQALARAGYAVLLDGAAGRAAAASAGFDSTLTGCIWTFRFRCESTPVLEVDLALALCDLRTSAVLWEADFPGREAIPFWVGLGCEPGATVSSAFAEVEAAAALQFASPSFGAAWKIARGLQIPRLHRPESHHVVGPHSWTATEAGEVRASAHVSGTAPQPHLKPGDLAEAGASGQEAGRPETVAG